MLLVRRTTTGVEWVELTATEAGFLSEGDGDGEDTEDMAALQMECTVHEVLLKNQVRNGSCRRLVYVHSHILLARQN